MNLAGKLRLHDATLVVAHLGPRIREEGPYFSDRSIRRGFEELRSVDLRDAQIGQALLACEQHGMRHARIVDLKRQEGSYRGVQQRPQQRFPPGRYRFPQSED